MNFICEGIQVTESRQIQLFGLLGSLILVLFIVIFLGRDFYQLYLQNFQNPQIPGLSDEQIVMEAQAVDQLQEQLDEEGAALLEAYTKRQEGAVAVEKPENNSLQTTVASDVLLHRQKDNAAHESAAASKEITEEEREKKAEPVHNAEVVLTQAEDIRGLNRRIHRQLQKVMPGSGDQLLSEEFRQTLQEVVSVLRDLPFACSIEVEGHTPEGVSKRKSQQMAQQVADYLKGLLADVPVRSVGYGSTYPISDDLRDPANRRVEIIVRRREI